MRAVQSSPWDVTGWPRRRCAETLVGGQNEQVAELDAGTEHPEPGVGKAKQSRRRQPDPVGGDHHAEWPRVERGGQILNESGFSGHLRFVLKAQRRYRGSLPADVDELSILHWALVTSLWPAHIRYGPRGRRVHCGRVYPGWLGPLGSWVAGWLGGWVAGWLGGWVAGWLGGWVAGWLGGRVATLLGGWVAGWLGGWAAGSLGRWVAGSLGRWVAGSLDGCVAV